ncbi:MAG: DUF3108 domain-containing protein [Steroidobacteraceae bacterium]|nr:DUF3108 domain-containing protein [Steroidobacteraceae bacterium]
MSSNESTLRAAHSQSRVGRAVAWLGLLLAAGVLLQTGARAGAVAAPKQLAPFTAAYSVEWKGITAGVATLTLLRLGIDDYRYDSTTVARGLARLLVSDPVKQTSDFKLVDGQIQPLKFRGIDEKERKTELDFDWSRGRVTGTARGNTVDLALPDGTQDAMSLQIATLLQLRAGSLPTRFKMIDGDEIKDYEQRREGTERIKTVFGEIDTVVYSSKRPDGNRITRTWYAPSLDYLPVLAQRVRDGKVEVTMRIRELQRATGEAQ